MSPEQTGRMNRAIDHRNDLYSLGVTFYQMLSGVLPFQASDPLEWIHCHIAREPPSPRAIVPPQYLLPIHIYCGTTNQALINDPLYLGLCLRECALRLLGRELLESGDHFFGGRVDGFDSSNGTPSIVACALVY